MSKRLDELFAPERLRTSWKGKDNSGGEKGRKDVQGSELKKVMITFERLKFLIERDFRGEQKEVLSVMMDELYDILLQRFPQDIEDRIPQEDEAALNPVLWEMIDRIEDVVEAFETANQEHDKNTDYDLIRNKNFKKSA